MQQKPTLSQTTTFYKKPSLNMPNPNLTPSMSTSLTPISNSNSTTNPVQSEINTRKDQIMGVIDDLNGRLMEMFRRKEQQLLDEYKKEMFKAKNELNELRENTNEEELRKRMIQKKEELQREREQFLQASIFFSNKCESFKAKLAKVVNQTKDLENEIKFLNQQIENATRKNLKLKESIAAAEQSEDIGGASSHIGTYLNTPQGGGTVNALLSISSQKPTSRTVITGNLKPRRQQNPTVNLYTSSEKKEIRTLLNNEERTPTKQQSQPSESKNLTQAKRLRDKNNKIKEILKDPVFQENRFESLFIESVEKVKAKKKVNKQKTLMTLPTISKREESSASGIGKQGEFNQFDKRQIMEDFLSKEEVKRYLYGIIFKDAGDKTQANAQQIRADIFEKNFDEGPM